jgi:hypothetical protein
MAPLRCTFRATKDRRDHVSRPTRHPPRVLEGKILLVPPRRLVRRRSVECRRRFLSWRGRRLAPRHRRRVRTRRAVARGPDHPFASRTAALARTIPTLEVRGARVALREPVVPHRAAANGTERHSIGRDARVARTGWGRATGRRVARGRALRGLRRTGCGFLRGSGRDRRRAARGPDHPPALAILALEVGCLRVPLPFTVVPHRPAAFRAGRRGGWVRAGGRHRMLSRRFSKLARSRSRGSHGSAR